MRDIQPEDVKGQEIVSKRFLSILTLPGSRNIAVNKADQVCPCSIELKCWLREKEK